MADNDDQLTKSDFLSWYNDEITRYRNNEWKIAGYSISVSYLTVIFATNETTKFLVDDKNFIITLLTLYWLALLFAEIHNHVKLLRFRKRRALLLKGEEHLVINESVWKGNAVVDYLWFFGFISFPLIVFILALVTIVNFTT